MAGCMLLAGLTRNLSCVHTKCASPVGLRQYVTLAQRACLIDENSNSKLEKQKRINQVVCVPSLPLIQSARSTSFFNKLTADQLWKGVTSVSNAGRKQGRGKGVGRKIAKNLNRGQIIGIGSENMVWPGLNAPVIRGRELVQQQKLPKDEEREAKLIKMRNSMGSFRALRISPLERGWSGTKMPGRSIGPPDPIGEDNFEGFDTKVLELKVVTCMTAVFGRKRRMSMFVVTGNGNGLGGFALAKATTVTDVIRKAKNVAGQRLLYIERYNEHTVLHDFFTQYGYTKLFVKKMPKGYGLVCHRAIRSICETIGIKDIHAKVEGSTNVQNLTKAFFLGLINQKTHQQLADEKQLNLVEFREENLNFPRVVAAPQSSKVRLPEEIPTSEELDFTRYVMDGKVQLQRKKHPPFYKKLPSYNIYLKKFAKHRNREKVQVDMLVERGELCSFYTDQYAECRPGFSVKQEEA
ncbi:small ribosomal subunit protein uS5m [Procambarus clarkii]|uniref:small ribosomal subunit protein uS5m n=1 Tax=Procambarus clarkii TaxID=6728 RepID=UPI001E678C18|nr:28S ribosomal protein S5, mitochondrial-like [Procambarus clarkii]